MSKGVNVSDDLSLTLGGSLDFGLDNIQIKELPTVSILSNSKLDVGLDNIKIKELPRINLAVELAVKPTRVHLPLHFRFGISALGAELLTFSICGESMVVIEDYQPHKAELCR